MLVKTALRECDFNVEVDSVDDGERAMAFLRHEGEYSESKLPQLVLLDLNLPRKAGTEVLLEIKNDTNLKALPVVVFTSSANHAICQPIYQQHANTCARKPADLDEFLKKMKVICEYWFHVACLPAEG